MDQSIFLTEWKRALSDISLLPHEILDLSRLVDGQANAILNPVTVSALPAALGNTMKDELLRRLDIPSTRPPFCLFADVPSSNGPEKPGWSAAAVFNDSFQKAVLRMPKDRALVGARKISDEERDSITQLRTHRGCPVGVSKDPDAVVEYRYLRQADGTVAVVAGLNAETLETCFYDGKKVLGLSF